MSQTQKITIGLSVIILAIVFALMYRSMFSQESPAESARDGGMKSVSQTVTEKSMSGNQSESVPSTPDDVAKNLLEESDQDGRLLDSEAASEAEDMKNTGNDINSLNQTYDENEL